MLLKSPFTKVGVFLFAMMTTWDNLRSLVRAHLEAARGRNALRLRGADLRKIKRNWPHLLLWQLRVKIDLTRPEERLIVYGTLMPGGQYHHLMADLAADWEKCTIRGRLGTYHGYPSFKWNPTGESHPVWLVTSAGLSAKFRELDDFEGDDYLRRLVPAEVGSRLVIAYIYEGRVKA
jgi:gamma-glutamylcyclotransferase (GGCT)/AIG2-like uncharacterized protein YtfP